MTNIVASVVVMVVTNWSNPVIPPAQFEKVQKLQGVPEERYRLGQVEEVTVAKVPAKQGEVQVVLDKVLFGYVEQYGKATETINWDQTKFTKKQEPAQATNKVNVVKTPTNQPVLSARVNPPVQAPKKGFWGRLFSK